MAAAVDDVRCGRLTGANVTMPHKRAAARLSDRLSPEADRAGAVNTLVRVGLRVDGYNTDVSGIKRAWEWANLPAGRVLILGAGGAAAAALVASQGWDVFVASRRPEAADDLVAATGVAGTVVPWEQPIPGAVVVNATPLGMHGEHLPNPVLDFASGLFDMAYGAGATPSVLDAQERELPVASGPDMLLGQALEAFELWTGVAAPVAAMRTAMMAGFEAAGTARG
jgi:shikimate dehydrogenase